MQYWLLKTEPDSYSFEDLIRDGKTTWDGVTNNWALQFLRRMEKGDNVFIYHTGKQKCITGIAEVVKGPHPDPRAGDETQVVVEVKPVKKLEQPVPLQRIREDRRFSDFELVRSGRLSVVPVSEERWKLLLSIAGA